MNTPVDGFGIQGLYFCAGSIVALSLSAVLAFFYFWKKGRLGFDEEAKYQMLKEDEDEERRRRH